ncbi:helix-turn-helix transcriptional regulator [Kribbella soli]|uniref:Helix-turn-helix domain-containing protein n=1 Tax=Kribbella soli TaxID=1124743 RepID=A0A4R0HJX1_9ACTN|nr:helix-turn-helix transcriptional regulator [Kribbella soli]TCC11695.1 helix-turn-helix domain-containing protein [Kribbella soli]
MDFPAALRQHRSRRRLSQLELAVRAGTTQRHLSFLESGRSAPGRNLVVRLAESLELPLRDCNELLLTAGYAPVSPERGLEDPDLAPARDALGHILDSHLPYPALIVDRAGDLIAANGAFGLLTEGADPGLTGLGKNVYRLALHPDGLAPRIGNLAEWARHILHRLDRDSALYAELSSYVPPPDQGSATLGFAVPLELRTSRGDLRLMTTVTTFATAVDVTLSELKLEAFLPVDSLTAEALRQFTAG